MTASPGTLSSDDRNHLRAFIRRVRDCTTPGFTNRRIGSVNQNEYALPGGAVTVRETWDGILELELRVDDDDLTPLPDDVLQADGSTSGVARTLLAAVNDTFRGGGTFAMIDDFEKNSDTTYVLRYSVTGNRPV